MASARARLLRLEEIGDDGVSGRAAAGLADADGHAGADHLDLGGDEAG